MRLFLLTCVLPSLGQVELAENYGITFSKDGRVVTECDVGDTIDVALSVLDPEGTLSNQEREITNFNEDMSDVGFAGATYVEGSLANALGSATSDVGFLKAFEFVDGARVSLTTQIRFRIVPEDNAVSATVTCKGNRFRIFDPAVGTRIGNKELAFSLAVNPEEEETKYTCANGTCIEEVGGLLRRGECRNTCASVESDPADSADGWRTEYVVVLVVFALSLVCSTGLVCYFDPPPRPSSTTP